MGPLIWILIVLAACLILSLIVYGILCLIEPHRHELTHINLTSSKPSNTGKISLSTGEEVYPVANDPIGKEADLRLFFFSDIHIETCFISSDAICRHIEEEHNIKPFDAVIFGGDIVTWPKYKEKGFAYLRQISSLCRKLDIPFMAVTGNHDIALSDTDVEKECGVELIEGRYKVIRGSGGKEFSICGVDDTGREEREWFDMPECPEGRPVVFVAHDPDAILHTGERLPDFMLSGHTHGGQLYLPFGIRIAPRHKNVFPRAGILKGIFRYRNTTLFISRGLGCGYLPIRSGSVPELSVIEISCS